MKKSILIIFAMVTAITTQSYAQTKKSDRVSVVLTAKDTHYKMSRDMQLELVSRGQPFEHMPSVFVDTGKTFQTFIGIGGALTDASAETFAKLPKGKQQEFLQAYFSREKGIGYTIARTNMNSCDFSSASYTYVTDNDTELKTFNIAPDERFKLPLIKKAMEASGSQLKLYISPWSPPAWMKGNKNMLQGGTLMKEYYRPWAEYFIKFIQAYEERGVPVWGLTVQNEPMAKQKWESCIYTAEEERDFIKNHLGPALWKFDMKDKKLIAWDHNRDLIYHRASTILSDREAAKFVWGIGFHWYESWTGAPTPENVKRVAESFPQYPLLLTEACNYPFSWDTFDQWHWGENYATSMISDFNNGAVAWTDWNVLLDETGGPNHVQNFCFAPVHADTRDGSLHYMNSYYYIGHFSKFILPGAKRITVSSNRAQLEATGFRNPDGTFVVIVLNQGDTQVDFRLYIKKQAADVISLPHSIMTLMF